MCLFDARWSLSALSRIYVHSVIAFTVSSAESSSIKTASDIWRTVGSPKQFRNIFTPTGKESPWWYICECLYRRHVSSFRLQSLKCWLILSCALLPVWPRYFPLYSLQCILYMHPLALQFTPVSSSYLVHILHFAFPHVSDLKGLLSVAVLFRILLSTFSIS